MKLASGEHGEVRYPLDVVPCGQFRKSLRIDLKHDGAAGEVSRHLGHMRGGRPARTAPRCPEIHENRDLALAHNLVELRRVNFDRLGDSGQGGLARPAPSCIGEMRGWNSIWLCTGGAISDNGHDRLLHSLTRSTRNGTPMFWSDLRITGTCRPITRVVRNRLLKNPRTLPALCQSRTLIR